MSFVSYFAVAAVASLFSIIPTMLIAATACERVSVGAIRWDAWHGDDTSEGKAVERSLEPEKWKDRWPDFQTIEADGIEFDGAKPEIVAREMKLAKHAGLDYWAFMFYGRSSPMGRVLNKYLLVEAEGPHFALVIGLSRLLGEQGEKVASEAVELMMNPRYMRDNDAKPLIFIWVPSGPVNPETLIRGIARLKSSSTGRAGDELGLVIMSFSISEATKAASLVGSDRISTYAWHANPRGGAYRDLATGTEKMWRRQAKTGLRVVPIVMSGWDPRPRIEHPVPWATYPADVYYRSPTPEELSRHLGNGIDWASRDGNGGCTTLIYAWNEFDEGGWIAPTIGDRSNAKLKAVHNAVERFNRRRSLRR